MKQHIIILIALSLLQPLSIDATSWGSWFQQKKESPYLLPALIATTVGCAGYALWQHKKIKNLQHQVQGLQRQFAALESEDQRYTAAILPFYKPFCRALINHPLATQRIVSTLLEHTRWMDKAQSLTDSPREGARSCTLALVAYGSYAQGALDGLSLVARSSGFIEKPHRLDENDEASIL